jgi:hypothetical protein
MGRLAIDGCRLVVVNRLVSDGESAKRRPAAATGKRELQKKSQKGVDSPWHDVDVPPPFDAGWSSLDVVVKGELLPISVIQFSIAGWSSLVARQAHNLKVVGSNPTPAPNEGRFRQREPAFAIFPCIY